MSTMTQLLWGALGGTIAFIAVFALPELRAMWQDPNFKPPSLARCVVALLLGLCFIALGAAGPLLFDDATKASQAIAYGIAAESLIGNVIRGVSGQ